MSKPAIFSTRQLFQAARTILDEHFQVDYWKGVKLSRADLLKHVADKDGLVCLLTEKVNLELLNAAPKLRIAANVAVGFDNIDVAACTKRGVIATNTPGVLDETTADFAWTLMMAVARRLVEGMGFGSVGGDGCVGQDAGDCGIWADRKSDGAAGDWFSDESDLCGCGAGAGGGGERIERGISRDEYSAGGSGLRERACAALAGDAPVV